RAGAHRCLPSFPTRRSSDLTWGNLASWEDADGTRWVLAPVGGPKHPSFKFPITNGDAPHGSIVAFKVEDKDGKPELTPVWMSRRSEEHTSELQSLTNIVCRL